MSCLTPDYAYIALPRDTEDVEEQKGSRTVSGTVTVTVGKGYLVASFVVGLLTLLTLWTTIIVGVSQVKGGDLQPQLCPTIQKTTSVCMQPTIRKEWRTLTNNERTHYTAAVKCLADQPSKLHDNSSLYDDFPSVHKDLSPRTHSAASFLPWHRLYIHHYERLLKEHCGMRGSLPYWDWTLDWEAPENAPVWDQTTGMGGDGDANGPETVGNGRCVTNGPFAGLEAKYFDGVYQPHCLSRGFAPAHELRELGKLISPDAIDDMMQLTDYQQFEHEVEHRAHHFLSNSVRGDLSRFTGPNDPVFFLHHTNIDRLWWQWQMLNQAQNLYAYNGKANNVSNDAASLAEYMDMGGLGTNMRVVDLMETDGRVFCYTY